MCKKLDFFIKKHAMNIIQKKVQVLFLYKKDKHYAKCPILHNSHNIYIYILDQIGPLHTINWWLNFFSLKDQLKLNK